MEIHFAGQYNKQDFVRAFRTNIAPTPVAKVFVFGTWAFIAIAVIMVIALVLQGRYQREGAIGYVPSILLFAAVVGYQFYRPHLDSIRALKNPDLQEPISGYFDRNGFHVDTKTETAHLGWEHFVRVIEREDYVMIYRGNNLFNLFPRRFFDREADWKAFIVLAKEKVKK